MKTTIKGFDAEVKLINKNEYWLTLTKKTPTEGGETTDSYAFPLYEFNIKSAIARVETNIKEKEAQ